jgi:hypothetical protein
VKKARAFNQGKRKKSLGLPVTYATIIMDAIISTPSTSSTPPPNASFPHTLAMMAAPINIGATMIIMIIETADEK